MRILSLLGASFVLAACASNPPPPPAPPGPPPAAPAGSAAPAAALKAPGEAKVGDRTKCPVSGEEFVVTESSPKVEQNGKTYYFCCPGCEKKFKADPAKFSHGA